MQVLEPVHWTCTAFECILNDRILEDHIPRTAIVHRNYLQGLPQGTRNTRARDGDIWTRLSHTFDFIHWMARHPPGTKDVDWRLETDQTHRDVNANLDGPDWRRCHLPETLSWTKSSSITRIGDLIVGIVMHMTGISPIDVLAHIRMIWETEMMNRKKINDAKGEPIYGTVAGDEPPPPPQTKFAYYFN